MNDSIGRDIIDLITIDLYSKCIATLKRKIATNPTLAKLKHQAGISELESSIQNVIEISMANTKSKIISIKKSNIKNFFKSEHNNAEIIRWATTMTSIEDFDLRRFEMLPRDESVPMEIFLIALHLEIINVKKKTFNANTLNIIDAIENANTQVIDMLVEEVIPEIKKQPAAILEILQEIKSSINLPTLNDGDEQVRNAKENQLIKTIKDFIDKGQILTAREMITDIFKDIRSTKKSKKSNEYLFLLNAYAAETFLRDPGHETEAIPYLNESALHAKDKFKVHRNRAFAKLLEGKYEEALELIDKAIEKTPNEWSVLNLKIEIESRLLGVEKAFKNLVKLKKLYRDNHEYLFQCGWLLFKANELDKSINFLTRAISNNDTAKARDLLGNVYLKKTDLQSNLEWPPKIEVIQENLDYAIYHLTKAIELYGSEENQLKASSHYVRGIAESRLTNNDNASLDFKAAESLGLEHKDFCFQHGMLCLQMNEYEGAIERFEKSIKHGKKGVEIVALIMTALSLNGNSTLALEKSEKYVDDESDFAYDLLDIYLARAEALIYDLKTSEAEKLLEDLKNKWSTEPKVIIEYARFKIKVDDLGEAIKLLEIDDDKNFGELEYLRIMLLCDAYKNRGNKKDFVKIISLLKPIIDVKRPDGSLIIYTETLRRQGKLGECLEICKEVHEQNGIQIFFHQLAVDIYYNELADFNSAAQLLKELIRVKPGDAKLMVNYAGCLYMLGSHQEAIDSVRQVENKISDRKNEILFISSAYENIGQHQKALELALEGLELNNNDPRTHLFYYGLFLRSENYLKNIDKKYIRAFQQILENFNERFPNEKSLIKMKIPDDPTDIKEFFTGVLKEKYDSIKEIEAMYTKQRLPIAFLAKASGKSVFATSLALFVHPHLNIWISTGRREETEREKMNISGNDKILIDASALLFSSYFNLLDKLVDSFAKIYITNSTMMSLREQILFEQLSVKKGSFSLSYDSGDVVKHEISAEFIRERIEFYNSIIEWVDSNSNVELIGNSVERVEQNTDGKYKMIIEVLGKGLSDTILESFHRNIPTFCIDSGVRQLLENEFSRQTFGLIPYIDMLLKEMKLSEVEFHDIKIQLVNFSCHFVPINSKTLQHCVEKNNFESTPLSLKLFDSLAHPENDLDLLINIASEFLHWLWHSNIVFAKDKWTNVMLSVVIKEREGNQSRLIKLIEANVSGRLEKSVKIGFLAYCSQWKKSNNIIEIIF